MLCFALVTVCETAPGRRLCVFNGLGAVPAGPGKADLRKPPIRARRREVCEEMAGLANLAPSGINGLQRAFRKPRGPGKTRRGLRSPFLAGTASFQGCCESRPAKPAAINTPNRLALRKSGQKRAGPANRLMAQGIRAAQESLKIALLLYVVESRIG